MSFLLPEKVKALNKIDKEFLEIFNKQILYRESSEIESEKYNAVNHQISVDNGKESFKKWDYRDNNANISASKKYFFAKVGNDHIIGSKIPFRDGWVGVTNCIVFKIYAKVEIDIENGVLIAKKVDDSKYYKACGDENYPYSDLTKITQTGGKKQRKSMKSKKSMKSRKIKNKKSRKSYRK